MATVKYVQTRDPDTGQLSEKHLLEVVADNVIFEEENMTLPQKMDTKADKVIYGDDRISKGRYYNSTEGEGSIAFGVNVQAINQNSTALGNNTIVNSAEGLVTGRYNIIDSDEKYAFIIGNGLLDAAGLPKRSNAFAVDWNGNIYGNKFVDMNGHEALTTLKNIRVGDNTYELHGTTLHLVAGHNIVLNSLEIESDDVDGTTSHVLQVTITADKNAAGDGTGTGGGLGDGLYLPLVGGTEYGPVIFNNVYDRSKFTTAEREAFIKNSPKYSPDLSDKEKEELLYSMSYIPIVVGNPSQTHLDIDCTSTGKSVIDSYNERNRQGDYLYLNKSKGIVIIGTSAGSGIVWNPKKRSGGTGININNIGTASFGWGTGVSPTGQNSIALGATTRASGSSSFAVGDSTRASGISSFAEGIKTIAGGSASHAEGSYTITRASCSHTEGYGTITGGLYSHNEGYGSNATIAITNIDQFLKDKDTSQELIIQYWEKEEKFSFAAGNSMHMEGKDNIGFGDYSHIEGIENLSTGYCSHLEGERNEEHGVNNHVEGGYNYLKGQYNHLEGFGHSNEGYYNHISGYMHHLKGKYSFVSGIQNLVNGHKNFIHGKNILINANKIIAFGEKIYVEDYNRAINQRFIIGNNINIGNNTKYSILEEDFGSFILGSNLSLSLGANINTTNFFIGKKNIVKTQSKYIDNILFGIGNSIINEEDKDIKNDYIIGINNTYQEVESTNDFIYATDSIFNNIQSSNNIILLKSSCIKTNSEDKYSILNNNILLGSNQFYIDTLSSVGIIGNNNTLKLNQMFSSIIIGDNINFDKTLDSHSVIYSENTLFYGYNIIINDNSLLLNSNIQGFNLRLLSTHFENVFITSMNSIFNNCTLKNIYIEGIEHNLQDYICEEDIEGCAHIEGYRNSLYSQYGLGTHIEGAYNKAGIGSHVEGYENIVTGQFSHAEGKNNYILSLVDNYSLGVHVEGNNCNILGKYSHIEGAAPQNNIEELLLLLEEEQWITKIQQLQREESKYHFSFGNYNHNEGLCNLVLSSNSHTEGVNNINNMNNSHIEGENNYNTSKENYSIGGHTEGCNNINAGKYSHIEGIGKIINLFNEDITYELWKQEFFNYTDGEGNHVEGIENFGHGKASHVEGYHNAALGDYSHASGTLSVSKGKNSYAAGVGTITEYENQYAIGKYNKSVEDAIIMIGNGKTESTRENVVEISRDGIIKANGFELSSGEPIGGTGSELPIGTIITNRNPNSSGIDYGIWENLGSQEVVLSKGTYTIYYWERTKGWIEPSEDEIYSIIGREVPSSEIFVIDDDETSKSEVYSIKEVK
jgi:hypothetical protein